MMLTIFIEQICRILLNPSSDVSKQKGYAALFQVFQLFGFYFADTQKKYHLHFVYLLLRSKFLLKEYY